MLNNFVYKPNRSRMKCLQLIFWPDTLFVIRILQIKMLNRIIFPILGHIQNFKYFYWPEFGTLQRTD